MTLLRAATRGRSWLRTATKTIDLTGLFLQSLSLYPALDPLCCHLFSFPLDCAALSLRNPYAFFGIVTVVNVFVLPPCCLHEINNQKLRKEFEATLLPSQARNEINGNPTGLGRDMAKGIEVEKPTGSNGLGPLAALCVAVLNCCKPFRFWSFPSSPSPHYTAKPYAVAERSAENAVEIAELFQMRAIQQPMHRIG